MIFIKFLVITLNKFDETLSPKINNIIKIIPLNIKSTFLFRIKLKYTEKPFNYFSLTRSFTILFTISFCNLFCNKI